jgi:hypothetical protein
MTAGLSPLMAMMGGVSEIMPRVLGCTSFAWIEGRRWDAAAIGLD